MRRISTLLFAALSTCAWAQNDLGVSNLSVEYPRNPLHEGDVLTVSVDVTNHGAEKVMGSILYIYLGEERISTISYFDDDLKPGATIPFTETYEVPFGSKGEVRAQIRNADDNPANDVVVWQENGDTVDFSVVRKYANELLLSDMSVTSGNERYMFYEDDELNVATKIINHGRETQSARPIHFYKGDELIDTKQLPAIAPEDTAEISFAYKASLGEYPLRLVLDADENPANDAISTTLLVARKGYLTESFESETFPPQGWIGGQWSRSNIQGIPSHGVAAAYSSTAWEKLITPKLDVQKGDELSFTMYVTSRTAELKVLTSTDMQEWTELASFPGNGRNNIKYTLLFNDTTNSNCIGKRYFAFSAKGFVFIDKVQGPRIIKVEDDFELSKLGASDYLRQGKEGELLLTVRNVGVKAGDKKITVSNGDETFKTLSTGSLQPGESKELPISFTPQEALPTAVFSAEIENDDADGNNKVSFSTLVYPAEAAQLPLSEGFEEKGKLADYLYWSKQDSIGGWYIGASSGYTPAYEGEKMLAFSCSYEGVGRLFTPQYELRLKRCVVAFQMYRSDTESHLNNQDELRVYFCKTPDLRDIKLLGSIHRSVSFQPIVGKAGYYHYVFEFDVPTPTEGFFMFEGVATGTPGASITIDNLEIYGVSDQDLTLTEIRPIDGTVVWANESAEQEVSVTLRNDGFQPIEGGTVHWAVDDAQQADFEWSGTLQPGEETAVSIGTYRFAAGETHRIAAEIRHPADIVADNDTCASKLIVKQTLLLPYANSFEEENSLDEWLNLDADGDGKAWVDSTVTVQDGKRAMISYSFDEKGDELEQDNYLITPGISLDLNKAILTFHVGAGDVEYFAETYEVLISETDRTAESFKQLHRETLTSDKYKEVKLEIDGYKGKNVFIAFRHVKQGEGNLWLALDNISLAYPENAVTVNVGASPSEGGTVQGSGLFLPGETVTVTAVPNVGYEFVEWTESGQAVSSEPTYAFEAKTSVDLVANFRVAKFDIAVTSEGEGTITPAGAVSVAYGKSQTFQFAPAARWKVGKVLVDGQDQGEISSYTFEHVTAAHQLHVEFVPTDGVRNVTSQGLSIYPNPFDETVRIAHEGGIKRVAIADLTGKIVFDKRMGAEAKDECVINPDIQSGVYMLAVQGADGQTITRKLVKK